MYKHIRERLKQVNDLMRVSINCGQRLISNEKGGTESKNGNGEAVASAFVGQFYPLHVLFIQKKWTTTAVGIPILIVVAPLSFVCCPIHN